MKYIQIYDHRYNLANIVGYHPSGSQDISFVLNNGKIVSEKFKTESQRDDAISKIDEIVSLDFEADEIITTTIEE